MLGLGPVMVLRASNTTTLLVIFVEDESGFRKPSLLSDYFPVLVWACSSEVPPINCACLQVSLTSFTIEGITRTSTSTSSVVTWQTALADLEKTEVGSGQRGLGGVGIRAKQQFQWRSAAETARTGGWDRFCWPRSCLCRRRGGHLSFGYGNVSMQVPLAILENIGSGMLAVAVMGLTPTSSPLFSLLDSSEGGLQSENSKSGLVGQWHRGDRFGGTTSVDSRHKRWAKRLWIFGRGPQWMVHRGCLRGVRWGRQGRWSVPPVTCRSSAPSCGASMRPWPAAMQRPFFRCRGCRAWWNGPVGLSNSRQSWTGWCWWLEPCYWWWLARQTTHIKKLWMWCPSSMVWSGRISRSSLNARKACGSIWWMACIMPWIWIRCKWLIPRWSKHARV